MLVSVIVPAYKQEKTIKEDVRSIYNTMRNTRWDFELIVVVDGYLDRTFEEVKSLGFPELSVIGYKKNRGKGYAVRYGMEKAVGDYIAFIDAGMDIDPNGISMILEHMQWYNADIIVGSKRHPASRVAYPWWRKLYSWGFHTIVRLLFGLKVTDTQTGLKVFKREVLEQVLPRLTVEEFAFDVELLSVAYRLGYKRIYEAPVEVDWGISAANSNFGKLLILEPKIQTMLKDTLVIFYRMHVLRYYDNTNKSKWVKDAHPDEI